VVLEAGVNDLKTIAQFPEQRAEILARCEANLRAIVEACRAAGATVVITSVFDIGDVALWRRPFWSDDVRVAVREVNTFLGGLAGEHVVLFDANPVLEATPGAIRAAYQVDYLHLTPDAYDALNRSLIALLASLPATTHPTAAP
jgi:lysophospholipase L1-like esterase